MNAKTDRRTSVPLTHYAQRFALASPAEMIGRTGAAFDAAAGRFSLTLLGRALYIAWPDFALCASDGSSAEGADIRTSPAAQILLLRYLLTAQAVRGTGRFSTYRETPWGGVYDANFENRCIRRLARTFGMRLPAFAAAMERLGARPIGMGDAGYELHFLGSHRMRAAIWAGDDELAPSAQILFSDDFPYAFSAEDMAVCGDILIGTMTQTVSEEGSVVP